MIKTKEKCDTQEKLVNALETIKSIKIINKEEFLGIDSDEFCRNLEIEINGNKFTITWFHNYSTIESEFMSANFDSITLTKPTWPLKQGSKLSLQLHRDGQSVVVI